MRKLNLKIKLKQKNHKKHGRLVLNVFYVISLILACVFQTSFDFLSKLGVLMILPVLMAVAMFEDVLTSCCHAFFASILCDLAVGLKVGTSCFVFVFVCLVVSWLTIHWVKTNLWSFLIFLLALILVKFLMILLFGQNVKNFFEFGLYLRKTMVISVFLTEFFGIFVFLFLRYTLKKYFCNRNVFLR